jgi:polyisoprenoid-binding protein YceI
MNQTIPLLLLSLLAQPLTAMAETSSSANAQRWVAHPDNSSITFTATQEGAEFTGRFHKFSVALKLHPLGNAFELEQLTTVIQLASVDTQYQERDDYLAEEDWFYTQLWPEARYLSEDIRQIDADHYIAEGTLTLRGVSLPMQVKLEITIAANGERGQLNGSAVVNRLDFGVGQGDWESTEWVGASVSVEFELELLRAFE